MIIDSFIYYNEADIAEIRIHELKDVVDKFIVVSGTTTFRGNSNPNVFPEHLRELAEIEVLRFDFPTGFKTWDAEHWLRNQIKVALRRHSPNDIAIVADADEIIRPEVVAGIDGKYSLEVDQYYYNFNTFMRQNSYMFSSKVKDLRNLYHMRFSHILPHLEGAGWEFSFFGDAEFVSNKLKNYSHSELDTEEYAGVDNIQRRMDAGIDIVDRPRAGAPRGPLPEYVLKNKDRFERFW